MNKRTSAVPVTVPRAELHGRSDFARDLLEEHGELWTRIATWSMAPLLRPGDLVKLVPCSIRLFRGELVAIDDADRLLIHRVVGIRRDLVIAKGDALPCVDPARQRTALIGTVIEIRRRQKVRFRIATRWPSAFLGAYSLAVSRLGLPPSGTAWRLSRLPFYLLARFE